MPSFLSTVLATDEDILLRIGSQFGTICPESQKLAIGKDGIFDASARWTLESATNDFAAQGVKAGHVCLLKGTIGTTLANAFGPEGEYAAVESVVGNSVVLRRAGRLAGEGWPIGPIGGITSVSFVIESMDEQIEPASYAILRRFGVDDRIPDRATDRLYDLRELRELCVVDVIYRNLTTNAIAKEGIIDYSKRFSAERDDLYARLNLHWGALGDEKPTTSRFSTRLTR